MGSCHPKTHLSHFLVRKEPPVLHSFGQFAPVPASIVCIVHIRCRLTAKPSLARPQLSAKPSLTVVYTAALAPPLSLLKAH